VVLSGVEEPYPQDDASKARASASSATRMATSVAFRGDLLLVDMHLMYLGEAAGETRAGAEQRRLYTEQERPLFFLLP